MCASGGEVQGTLLRPVAVERGLWRKPMRLRHPQDFRKVRSAGRSRAHALFILCYVSNNLDHSRIGMTASRKVGNAVARNRARRLLREAVRHLYPEIASGWDIVLIARRELVNVKEPEVRRALDTMLRRTGLIPSETGT